MARIGGLSYPSPKTRMRSRTFIAVCGFLVLLLVMAGVVYAYDANRTHVIAEGIRIDGIDVGGLTAGTAAARVKTQVVDPLAAPVTATYRSSSFELTSTEARVGVDVDGAVDEALRRSRSGNLLERTFRAVTGTKVSADVDVEITHDPKAVDAVARNVAEELTEPAVNAEVDLSKGDIEIRRSKEGRRVLTNRLRRDLTAALTDPEAVRTVRIRTKKVVPDVTTDRVAERYPAIIIVDRKNFRLTLYKHLRKAKVYKVAIGKAGMDTPTGLYKIENKAENPAWHVPDSEWAGKLAGKVIPPDDPRNPIEARWMAIYDGAGIHGTEAIESLGTAASHGCVRMAIPDVIELYDQVPVMSPVYIQ